MMKLELIFLVTLLCCVHSNESSDNDERTLSMTLNPGCKEQIDESQCDGITLVHIASENSEDTLHYVWDFTGFPCILMAKTDKNATLNIDWNSFMLGNPNSVNFSSEPRFVFSSVISKLLVFDDAGDKGDVNDDSVKNAISLNPRLFTWDRSTLNATRDRVVLIMQSNITSNETDTKRSFSMKVSNNIVDKRCCSN
jgi:Lysosomal transcription factor, NCU-G1